MFWDLVNSVFVFVRALHQLAFDCVVISSCHNLTLNNIKWKSEGVHNGLMEGGHKADFADVLDGLHY